MINKGNSIEIYYALELIAQLSFNKDIQQSINESKSLADTLRNLMKKYSKKLMNNQENQIYLNITQVIEQIQWNLNTEKRNLQKKQQHIMISYNSSSREICLRIKKELESLGHKVWIDVEQISGSSLESMINVVENSFCVLMCVTEKYRQSINCQLEAKHALKLNKPIIPLILQPGFEDPKGWLGMVMEGKMLVNFMKYDVTECIKKLKNEIDSIKSGVKILQSQAIGKNSTKVTYVKSNSADTNPNKIDLMSRRLENEPKITDSDDSAIDCTEARKKVSPKCEENNFSSKTENVTKINPIKKLNQNGTKLTLAKSKTVGKNLNENASVKSDSESLSDSTDNTSEDLVFNWSEARVKEWFIQNKLNLLLFEHFKPFNGKILKQLYETKIGAMSFYIQSINKIPNVEFKNVMSFGACLDDLFKK